MGFTLSQSQPLFSPKRKSVYPIFDIFLDKLKCQIPPVAYHLFEFFRRGVIYKLSKVLKAAHPQEKDTI